MNITQSFVAGATYADQSLAREQAAEDRARRIEREDAASFAREVETTLTNPDGTFKQASDLDQNQLMRLAGDKRVQGMLGVQGKDVRPVRMLPLPTTEANPDEFAIEVQQIDKGTGKVTAQGPITDNRTSEPNDTVTRFTPETVYNRTMEYLAGKDPQFATRLQTARKRGGILAESRKALAVRPTTAATAPAAQPQTTEAATTAQPAGSLAAPAAGRSAQTPPVPVPEPTAPVQNDFAVGAQTLRVKPLADLAPAEGAPPSGNKPSSVTDLFPPDPQADVTADLNQFAQKVAGQTAAREIDKALVTGAADKRVQDRFAKDVQAFLQVRKATKKLTGVEQKNLGALARKLRKTTPPATQGSLNKTKEVVQRMQPRAGLNTVRPSKEQADAVFNLYAMGVLPFETVARFNETGRFTKRELQFTQTKMDDLLVLDKNTGELVKEYKGSAYAKLKLADAQGNSVKGRKEMVELRNAELNYASNAARTIFGLDKDDTRVGEAIMQTMTGLEALNSDLTVKNMPTILGRAKPIVDYLESQDASTWWKPWTKFTRGDRRYSSIAIGVIANQMGLSKENIQQELMDPIASITAGRNDVSSQELTDIANSVAILRAQNYSQEQIIAKIQGLKYGQ
jgi:hypothetical protein